MPFEKELESLVHRLGAKGAVIVDREGELVAAHQAGDQPGLDLIGAHKSIIIDMASEAAERCKDLGGLSSIGITTEKVRLAVTPIKDGYSLVVVTETTCPLGRALFESKRSIRNLMDQF